MKWRVATKEDLIDMGRKFWRDIDKSNMSPGLAYTMFHKGISIEVLDESTQADDWLKVLQENLQAQIAGFYNHDKTPAEKKIRNAVIQEYKDLIAIFKHKFPSPPKK